jgi:hypothetical protein
MRPNKILGNKSKMETIIILVLVIYKNLPDRGLFQSIYDPLILFDFQAFFLRDPFVIKNRGKKNALINKSYITNTIKRLYPTSINNIFAVNNTTEYPRIF